MKIVMKMKIWIFFMVVSTFVVSLPYFMFMYKRFSIYLNKPPDKIKHPISTVVQDISHELPVRTTEVPVSTTAGTKKHSYSKTKPSWMNLEAEEMTAEDLMEYFAWTNSSSCRLAHNIGREFDERHDKYYDQNTVCILPKSVAPALTYCLVYSFEISDEWIFENAFNKGFGCEVFTFDPSIEQAIEEYDYSEGIHFHKLGLSSQNETSPEGWKLQTLATIRQMLGHENREIDYIKLVIGETEWFELAKMIEAGAFDVVKQISLKIHLPCCESPLIEYQQIANILRIMEQDYNMVRFSSKPDPKIKYSFPLLNSREMYFSYIISWYNNAFLNKKNDRALGPFPFVG